nr:hypothetical protein [Thermoanaerobacterales bacterium]
MDGQGCDGDLAEIMARMAEGDDAAMVTLYERYRTPIAGAVQRELRHRGVRLGRDEVGGLVIDVCLELRSIAGAWSPEGGATPWVWARHRIGNLVDRVAGGALAAVEAPLAATLDDADALVELAGHGQVAYAENLALSPAVAEAVDACRRIGTLTHLEVRFAQGRPPGGPDRTAPAWGGGAAFDLGVHALAVA